MGLHRRVDNRRRAPEAMWVCATHQTTPFARLPLDEAAASSEQRLLEIVSAESSRWTVGQLASRLNLTRGEVNVMLRRNQLKVGVLAGCVYWKGGEVVGHVKQADQLAAAIAGEPGSRTGTEWMKHLNIAGAHSHLSALKRLGRVWKDVDGKYWPASITEQEAGVKAAASGAGESRADRLRRTAAAAEQAQPVVGDLGGADPAVAQKIEELRPPTEQGADLAPALEQTAASLSRSNAFADSVTAEGRVAAAEKAVRAAEAALDEARAARAELSGRKVADQLTAMGPLDELSIVDGDLLSALRQWRGDLRAAIRVEVAASNSDALKKMATG